VPPPIAAPPRDGVRLRGTGGPYLAQTLRLLVFACKLSNCFASSSPAAAVWVISVVQLLIQSLSQLLQQRVCCWFLYIPVSQSGPGWWACVRTRRQVADSSSVNWLRLVPCHRSLPFDWPAKDRGPPSWAHRACVATAGEMADSMRAQCTCCKVAAHSTRPGAAAMATCRL
jgi:hypothetical protein